MNNSRLSLEERAWETCDKPEMVSFYTDDGDCWSVLWVKLGSVHYIAADGQVTIDCELGTFFVIGPKAVEFHNEFRDHKASKLKADGQGIVSVSLALAEVAA
jgi:hypothetical protein